MTGELDALRAASARVGGTLDLVQGAGGNTSLKEGETLWIKASGTWLADALDRDIFVPVDLLRLRGGIAAGSDDPVAGARVAGDVSDLRPSIETTFHGLMPHRVVIHVHSVNAISWAIRIDGQAAVAPRLSGLSWGWVPYARPGWPLTRAILEATGGTLPDVLLLANHGLVVGAATTAEAEALLAEVERRLAVEPRPAIDGDAAARAALAEGTGFEPVDYEPCHALALDRLMRNRAAAGSLYPDHVVFLGPGAAVTADRPALLALDERHRQEGQPPQPRLALVPHAGVLARGDLSAGGRAMVACLARVLARLPATVDLSYLDPDEVAGLLDWDAEQYRQALDRA